MTRIPEELTARARELRRHATPAERILWRLLSSHRPRFTRQLVVETFILDFACGKVRLAIELDGSQHIDSAYDARRTAVLEALGWHVIRFWNNQVLTNPEGVATVVLQAVEHRLADSTEEGKGS